MWSQDFPELFLYFILAFVFFLPNAFKHNIAKDLILLKYCMCKTSNISVSENEFSDDTELTLFLSLSHSSSALSPSVCLSNSNLPPARDL